MEQHTVLFVDDEVNILKAVQRLLRHEPWKVLVASRAKEALAILDGEPAQVVITDQRMPEMSGVDLLSVVRERHPDFPLRPEIGEHGDPWDHLPSLSREARALVARHAHRVTEAAS